MSLRTKISAIKIHDTEVVDRIMGDDREMTLTLKPNWSLGTAVGEELIKLGVEITGTRCENLSKIETDRDGFLKLTKLVVCHISCRVRQ